MSIRRVTQGLLARSQKVPAPQKPVIQLFTPGIKLHANRLMKSSRSLLQKRITRAAVVVRQLMTTSCCKLLNLEKLRPTTLDLEQKNILSRMKSEVMGRVLTMQLIITMTLRSQQDFRQTNAKSPV